MAENNNNDRHEKKKSILEIANETVQWLIFGSILSKKGEGGPPAGPDGKPGVEIPSLPAWAMNAFHFMTTEDEQEYDQAMDRFSTSPDEQMIFFKFKNKLVGEGYDEDHLRLMLVNLSRDWINRKDAKKTNIPDSAVNFINDIVLLKSSYVKQKKLAHEKKFLKKISLGKKIFLWATENKGKALALVFVIPTVVVCLLLTILFSII